jgi:mannitol/fructose-specific phosphotransferase system IIA component (Ntr-type)
VLARVSRLLREPKTRQELMNADSPAKALAAIREAESKL